MPNCYMKIRTKKYKLQGENAHPHIGRMLREFFTKEHISPAALARKLDIAESGMNQYYKRQSVQIGILWKIGLLTDYNFFAMLGEKSGIAYTTAKEAELARQLAEKEALLRDALLKIEVYKEIAGK